MPLVGTTFLKAAQLLALVSGGISCCQRQYCCKTYHSTSVVFHLFPSKWRKRGKKSLVRGEVTAQTAPRHGHEDGHRDRDAGQP